jgi:hypothetical protein
VKTAGEEKVLSPSFRVGDPGRYRGSRWFGNLKLDGSARFLLKNQRARRHDLAMADVARPLGHEVATSKLAIDGQIKKREIATTVGDLKPDANRPYFLELERRFLTHELAFIPRLPDRVCSSSFHDWLLCLGA